MYAVLYRWRVAPGTEQVFREAWREVMEDIRTNYGGGGSRLHRMEDGTFVAYARWPDRAARDKAFKAREGSPSSAALKMWESITETVDETWLEITDDLLLPEDELGPAFKDKKTEDEGR